MERSLIINLATNCNFFDLLIALTNNNKITFNEDGSISSYRENDIDDCELIQYVDIGRLKKVMINREDKSLPNYALIWFFDHEDSALVRCSLINKGIHNFKKYYEIDFQIGIGKRIKNADRYTDYGYYLSEIIPMIVKSDSMIYKIKCEDND